MLKKFLVLTTSYLKLRETYHHCAAVGLDQKSSSEGHGQSVGQARAASGGDEAAADHRSNGADR